MRRTGAARETATLLIILLALLGGVLAACTDGDPAAGPTPSAERPVATTTTTPPPATSTLPPDRAPDPSSLSGPGPQLMLDMVHLTQDPGDRFEHGNGEDWLRVWAPNGNRGENTRVLLYDADGGREATDQAACATWESQTGSLTQQGIALRVRAEGDRVRAITVVKNVVWAASWQLNVLTWDPAVVDGQPWRIRGAVDLKAHDPEGGLERAKLPVRVCARVIGSLLEVKAWPAGEPEPEWGARRTGGAVLLPPEWVYAGRVGWYVGHLRGGNATTLTDLSSEVGSPYG